MAQFVEDCDLCEGLLEEITSDANLEELLEVVKAMCHKTSYSPRGL